MRDRFNMSGRKDSGYFMPRHEGRTVSSEMDLTELTWRKSSQSAEQNCVMVAISNNAVLVRDSKDTDGPFLALTPGQWNAFIERMKQGGPA